MDAKERADARRPLQDVQGSPNGDTRRDVVANTHLDASMPIASPLIGETLGTPLDSECSSSSSSDESQRTEEVLIGKPNRAPRDETTASASDLMPTVTRHSTVPLHANSSTHDDTLQIAHQLALTRVMELEVQLRERSQQLLDQQEKVEGSRNKIANLSGAVQMLKRKVEETARRDNMLRVRAVPSTTSSTQTADDWEQAWHDAYAAQQALCDERDAATAQWHRVASRLETENAALQVQLVGANQRIAQLSNVHTQLSGWAHSLVDACLVASASSSATADNAAIGNTSAAHDHLRLWGTLTLDAADRHLGSEAAVLQTVAAVVGGGIGGAMQMAARQVSPNDTRIVYNEGRPGDATPSPQCRSAHQQPLPSPHVGGGGIAPVEGRSLLEELARASSAAHAQQAPHSPSIRPSAGNKTLGQATVSEHRHQGDAAVELRAIELRIEGLRSALLRGTMPHALRSGIEVEMELMQDKLASMANEKAHAMRLAMHRRDVMDGGRWQRLGLGPLGSGALPSASATVSQPDLSPPAASQGQLQREADVAAVSMSPAPSGGRGTGAVAAAFVMRSPSEEA